MNNLESNNREKVLLVGAGLMAREYAKVLKELEYEIVVFGRSESSCETFTTETGIVAYPGGLEKNLNKLSEFQTTTAVVAVNVEELAAVTTLLIKNGVARILVEKPAGLNSTEISELNRLAEENGTTIYIAYNRRCYSSVRAAQKLIKEDGGLKSLHFEFTERSHIIEKIEKPAAVKSAWFLANSTHVVDLAFFLAGNPTELSSHTTGSLAWHPAASIFSGSGVTEKSVLFSYQANWESPGNWSLELLTARRRIRLNPLEKLAVKKIGDSDYSELELENELDVRFKPGLYALVESFLCGENQEQLCTLKEQEYRVRNFYNRIAGYDKP